MRFCVGARGCCGRKVALFTLQHGGHVLWSNCNFSVLSGPGVLYHVPIACTNAAGRSEEFFPDWGESSTPDFGLRGVVLSVNRYSDQNYRLLISPDLLLKRRRCGWNEARNLTPCRPTPFSSAASSCLESARTPKPSPDPGRYRCSAAAARAARSYQPRPAP